MQNWLIRFVGEDGIERVKIIYSWFKKGALKKFYQSKEGKDFKGLVIAQRLD